jgi:uncharacterized YccA/Bax inhibitor family protein
MQAIRILSIILLDSLDTIIGIFIGGFITLLVARFYFKRSTEILLNPIKLILRGMEEGGIVKWTKDKKGEPISVTLQIYAKD